MKCAPDQEVCCNLQVVPYLIGLTFFVIVIFIIQTGNKNKTWEPTLVLWKSILISVGICLAAFLVSNFLLMPLWVVRIDRAHNQLQRCAPFLDYVVYW